VEEGKEGGEEEDEERGGRKVIKAKPFNRGELGSGHVVTHVNEQDNIRVRARARALSLWLALTTVAVGIILAEEFAHALLRHAPLQVVEARRQDFVGHQVSVACKRFEDLPMVARYDSLCLSVSLCLSLSLSPPSLPLPLPPSLPPSLCFLIPAPPPSPSQHTRLLRVHTCQIESQVGREEPLPR
jgi:hypothetical protein